MWRISGAEILAPQCTTSVFEHFDSLSPQSEALWVWCKVLFI